MWAQAAAAILVLAAGAAIANCRCKSGPEGFSVTTGWMPRRAPARARRSRAQPTAVEGWKPALVALEQQLRSEIRSTREPATPRRRPAAPADEATMRRVQQLIAESEQRHAAGARDALHRVHARHRTCSAAPT